MFLGKTFRFVDQIFASLLVHLLVALVATAAAALKVAAAIVTVAFEATSGLIDDLPMQVVVADHPKLARLLARSQRLEDTGL